MQAYEILGLSLTATDEEILGSYKALAREMHPDMGGSDEEMRLLNEARDAALALRTSLALPSMGPLVASGFQQSEVQRREEADRRVDREVRKIVSMHVAVLTQRRNTYAGMSAAVAIVGLVTSQALPAVSTFSSLGSVAVAGWASLFVAVPFAFGALVAQNRVQAVQATTDALAESFADISDCAEFLDSLASHPDTPASPWTRDDVARMIESNVGNTDYRGTGVLAAVRALERLTRGVLGMGSLSLRGVLHELGPVETAKIFLIRAVEHRLVSQHVTGTRVTYALAPFAAESDREG